MNAVFTIVAVLIASFIVTWVAKKLRLPTDVALILSGLFMSWEPIRLMLIDPNKNIVMALGDFALVSMMFLAGVESSWKILYSERKDATIIALFAWVIPFLLGFFVFYFLGFSMIVSIIIGICLSITAEATKAEVLLSLKKLKTKVGAALMGAGIFDDLLGIILFMIVSFLLKEQYYKEDLLLGIAAFAFFVGVFVEKSLEGKTLQLEKIESFFANIIIPFFFISIGLLFDFSTIIKNYDFVLVMIIVAIAGKLIGTFMVKPFTKFTWKQLHLIGWGMNSRGAVEIAIAVIAFRGNMIPPEIFSALIVMALVTTAIFPVVTTYMIKHNRGIMN